MKRFFARPGEQSAVSIKPTGFAALAAFGILVGTGGSVDAAVWVTNNEAMFLQHAGTAQTESFEGIPIDSWSYHTRLPSPIPALDLDDDPNDPNDGPNYDLDGHFTITGNSIAYAPLDELFTIFDYAAPIVPVDGNNYLSFAPWYNVLWPHEFDPDSQHPIVTFDNFDNTDSSINSFGFYLVDYTPDPDTRWIVMEYGDEYVPVNLEGPKGNYFIGLISDSPFGQVQLHTNQNGSSMKIDAVGYSSDGQAPTGEVPEPASILVWSLLTAAVGLGAGYRWLRAS